jgi:hypothetical protein
LNKQLGVLSSDVEMVHSDYLSAQDLLRHIKRSKKSKKQLSGKVKKNKKQAGAKDREIKDHGDCRKFEESRIRT